MQRSGIAFGRTLIVGALCSAVACASGVEIDSAPCTSGSTACAPQPAAARPAEPKGAAIAGMGGSAPSSITSPTPSASAPDRPAQNMNVPCTVAQIVGSRCTQCHSAQPKFGAPMALMTLADFHAPAKSDATKKVYEITPQRVNALDVTRRMPPTSSPALSAPDLQELNNWLSTGAQPTGALCPVVDLTSGLNPGGSTTTNTRVMPVEYNDPEMKCFQFRSHAPGDKTQPYVVSTTPDMYMGFTFMPPWKGMMYAKSFKPIIDNAKVLHHWLFFKNSGPAEDGAISEQLGTHPDGQLVHGWAPGGDPLYMDPDVGEEMPGEVSYMLETHYNNTTGGSLPDMSGIEVCATPKVPKNIASISWLGTDNILGATASGTCEPSSDEPIRIVNMVPHMHLAGRHMKAVINRADGTSEILHDQPFDFEYQIAYSSTKMIMPGDTITTTCTYNEPKTFGKGTNEEMCYLFTLYYPKLALTNGDLIGSALHGPDTCLQ